MPLTCRRAVCLSFAAGLLLWPAGRALAQTFPDTIEGYTVVSQTTPAPIRSTVPLTAPYRAVGVGTTLQILDESDPANPRVASQVILPSAALDMLVSESRLYIAAGRSGLIVMDVSNPLTPNFVSHLKLANGASALAINQGEKILYACGGGEIFHAITLKDPSRPKIAAYLTVTKGAVTDLVVVRKSLVAACGPKGLVVFDLEQPGRPLRVHRFKGLKAAVRISVDPLKDTLFAVADGDLGLALVSFPTWKKPVLKGSLPFVNTALDIQYLPGTERLVAALGTSGYGIVDASDPSNPVLLSQPASPSPVIKVAPEGSRPVLLCESSGLYSLDASVPSNPRTGLLLPGNLTYAALATLGNLAYISRGTTIEIWDYSDAYHPALKNTVTTPALALDLLVSDGLLIASCQTAGLEIFDISDPLAPAALTVFPVTGSAGQVALSGHLAAVANGSAGVLLLDLTIPAAPVQLGTWDYSKGGFVGGVAFSSPTTLWVWQNMIGITSLNVSTPSAPVKLGDVGANGEQGRLYFYGGFIYAMGGFGGWHILDIANPAKPSISSTISTSGAIHAAFSGTTMFLCDGNMGLQEYDLTTADAPVQTTLFGAPTFSFQSGVLTNGARVLSCREGGLWSLVPASCASTQLLLPCEGDTLSPFYRPLFTWKAQSAAKYSVQVSTVPDFKDAKTVSSAGTGTELKTPYWEPDDTAFGAILNRARKTTLFYWRVAYIDGGHKTFSETRTFYLPY